MILYRLRLLIPIKQHTTYQWHVEYTRKFPGMSLNQVNKLIGFLDIQRIYVNFTIRVL